MVRWHSLGRASWRMMPSGLAAAALMLILIVGCNGGGPDLEPTPTPTPGLSPTPEPSPSPTPTPEPIIVGTTHTALIPESDQAIFKTAVQNFMTSLGSKPIAQARADLVAALAASEGVTQAKLFEDGYSVFAKFGDGAMAVMSTLDLKAMNNGVNNLHYGAVAKAPAGVTVSAAIPAANGNGAAKAQAKTSSEAHAPTTRKVLILDPAFPDAPGSLAAINAVTGSLKQRGWTDADIVIKTRSTSKSTDITPDDFLNLKNYGLVVIFAHALYGAPEGDGSFYIQCCSAVDYHGVASEDRIVQWNTWIAEGKLLLCGSESGDASYYMRSDLLPTMAGPLPDSLVYLVCPYGWKANQVFENKGCGAFFGWDNLMKWADAYSSFTALLQKMATANPAVADGAAYGSGDIGKTSENPEGTVAALQSLGGTSSKLYLPAWATVTVDVETLPEGTVNKGLGISYSVPVASGVVAPQLDLKSANSGTIDSLLPVASQIEGSAVDKDANVLSTLFMTQTFRPGANSILLDFSRQHVQGTAYRIDLPQEGGKLYTLLFISFKFKENPHSNKYRLFTDSRPEGFEVYQPLTNQGLYIKGDECYDSEQIQSIYGNDPFQVPDGYVVWGNHGEIGNYVPSETMYDTDTGTWKTWQQYADEQWAATQQRAAAAFIDVIFP